MPLYRPSELQTFLSSLGVKAKKGLSQNFLIDGNIVRKMAEGLESPVLEIGPGPGVLTEELLRLGLHVTAVEKDDLFARELSRLDPGGNCLTVIHSEIQRFEPSNGVSVVGNIPYGITTDIFDWILQWRDRLKSVRLMVQEEVADKVTLLPQSKTPALEISEIRIQGLYTLFLNYLGSVKKLFSVPSSAFSPRPHIHSAVIELQMRSRPLSHAQEQAFFILARQAFQHKRKQIRSSLRNSLHGEITEELLERASLDKTVRPEEMTLQDWEQLLRFF